MVWPAKTASGALDHNKAITGPDLTDELRLGSP